MYYILAQDALSRPEPSPNFLCIINKSISVAESQDADAVPMGPTGMDMNGTRKPNG